VFWTVRLVLSKMLSLVQNTLLTSRSPQPVAQQQVRDTAAMWKSCRGELEAPKVSGANKKIPMKHLKGKKECSAMKVTRPTAQMKCLYTNAHSMGNKQEE